MSLDECFDNGMLRKGRPDKLKAGFSMKVAKSKLDEAKKLLDAGFLDSAVVCAYSSMFHAARALLFSDGIFEKSHYCLAQYLREEYAKKGKLPAKLITLMDAYRIERHEVMYGLESAKVKKEGVQTGIENAEEMIEKIENLLGMAMDTGKSNKIKGRSISRGIAFGEALICKDAISFFGDIDPKTGICVAPGHAIEGKCIAGKVFVFPQGKGSTVGSYTILQLKKNGKAPAAMVNLEAEPIIAVGAIISKIPMIDKLEKDPFKLLKDGQKAKVDANKGELII